jgi:hypothetical protein
LTPDPASVAAGERPRPKDRWNRTDDNTQCGIKMVRPAGAVHRAVNKGVDFRAPPAHKGPWQKQK